MSATGAVALTLGASAVGLIGDQVPLGTRGLEGRQQQHLTDCTMHDLFIIYDVSVLRVSS